MRSFIQRLRATLRTPPGGPDLWRLYAVLLIANELDLVLTYAGLSRGRFIEANPLMEPLLYTFWPLVMKQVPLAGLALGVASVLTLRPCLREQTSAAVSLATAVYAAVLIAHLLNILVTILPR